MTGLYWSALMLGRLAGPAIHARMGKLPIVSAAAVVVALAFGGVSLAPDARALGVVVALLGLALGPMAPTVLSVAGDRYTRGTGTVFGVMLSLGQIGSVALPWTVARVAAASGFRTAMLVPAAAAALLAFAAGGLWMRAAARGDLRRVPAEVP